jgi:Mrp family chromosome partitioning ATPase
MTTTNQAFIKAYRRDDAEAGPASPAGAAAQPARVDARPSLSAPAKEVGGRSALHGPVTSGVSGSGVHAGHETSQASGGKLPLSSYLNRTGRAAQSDDEILRPGTTIASFQWPPVCRALAQQCGGELDRLAQTVLEEAAAGRSLIGILSSHPARGATTIALCLAARLGRPHRRVILVDGNFSRPQVAARLEAAPTGGWQEMLRHRGTLSDAVIRAADDHLDVLALDERKPTNAVRLASGLQAVVTAGVLRHAYDVVLLDLGSFFDSESQPILLELVRKMGIDAVLAVTGPNDASDLAAVAAQLGRSGCELLGSIENRIATMSAA